MSNAQTTTVEIQTSKGTITLELDAGKAPATTENFMSYVRDSFFDGTIFHRVIPGFMIQGGGFSADMSQKPTSAPVKNEAGNGLRNDRGTIAMARTSDPHSATAQFFVNLKNNDFLNFKSETREGWGYTVFGKVTDGMDVVDAIAGVATGSRGGHQDVPTDPITIEKVSVAE